MPSRSQHLHCPLTSLGTVCSSGTLLTESQKRSVVAAIQIQAVARGFIQRQLYRHAKEAIRSWRSRELAEVGAPIVAWLRRRETVNEQIDELHRKWIHRIKMTVMMSWREVTSEGLPVRHTLDAELKARRHYRNALCLRVLWGWKRVAHHAHLAEVRWVNRDGRRVIMLPGSYTHTRPCRAANGTNRLDLESLLP